MLLCPFILSSPSFPPPLSISLFSVSASPSLLCKQVHQYHPSRFHICANMWYTKCPFAVQSLSHVWLFAIPWTATRQTFLFLTIPWSLLRLMSTQSVMPSNHLILRHPLLLQWVSSSNQVAKVLELQLQHQSFQWIFRVDFLYNWLVWSPCCQRHFQESSLAHSTKASVLQHLAFFIIQLSHLYISSSPAPG